jgi:phage-related protein (TIGR01555 family)
MEIKLPSAPKWITDSFIAKKVNDALANIMSGIGTSRDKSTWNRYVDAPILTVYDLETLWKDSALARKIISKIPQDALRAGFSVKRKPTAPKKEGAEDGAANDDLDAEAIAKRCNELGVTKALFKASCWGRLFGGGGIVLAVEGAGGPDTELDPEAISKITYLRVCDRQDFRPSYWRPDGSTQRWWWQRRSVGGGPVGMSLIELDTSRVLWFGGAVTTDRARERNEYWDLSILQSMFNTLVSYDGYWASLDAQVGDASQAVFHLQGFIGALAANSSETAEVLAKRLRLMDQNRSNSRALVMDAGDKDGNGREDFQVIERASLANMDKLTSMYLTRMATDAGYPVTVLFETSASGSNATGENDLNQHYNNVGEFRNSVLHDPATFLVQAVARELGIANPEEWAVCWPELYIPKPLDVASAEKMRVDSVIGLVTAGVALEEEVAVSMDKIAPSLGLHLDKGARKDAMAAGLDDVRNRTLMDPSEGEVAAQKEVKAAAPPKPGVSPPSKSSGRATKARANPSAGKNSSG